MKVIDTTFDTIPAGTEFFCIPDFESVGCAYNADEISVIAQDIVEFWQTDDEILSTTEIETIVNALLPGSEICVGGINVKRMQYGIFVNENGGIPYAYAIAVGIKPIETHNKNMLSALVGKRVAIVRTKRGKRPTIVGYATINKATFETASWLDIHRDLTLIPEGSAYDAKGKGKWCYHMSNAETCAPYLLPEAAVRHGRSFCEF